MFTDDSAVGVGGDIHSPSAQNNKEGIHRDSETQQGDELVYSDTATSTVMSDMIANFSIYFWQDLSDNYVTYVIEHKELPDEAALTGADIQGVQLLLANESATL